MGALEVVAFELKTHCFTLQVLRLQAAMRGLQEVSSSQPSLYTGDTLVVMSTNGISAIQKFHAQVFRAWST